MERQWVHFKDNNEDTRLDMLDLNDGEAVTAYGGIVEVLEECDSWSDINIILCDATNVTTGCQNETAV